MSREESAEKRQSESVWFARKNNLCIEPSPPCLRTVCRYHTTELHFTRNVFCFFYRLNDQVNRRYRRRQRTPPASVRLNVWLGRTWLPCYAMRGIRLRRRRCERLAFFDDVYGEDLRPAFATLRVVNCVHRDLVRIARLQRNRRLAFHEKRERAFDHVACFRARMRMAPNIDIWHDLRDPGDHLHGRRPRHVDLLQRCSFDRCRSWRVLGGCR